MTILLKFFVAKMPEKFILLSSSVQVNDLIINLLLTFHIFYKSFHEALHLKTFTSNIPFFLTVPAICSHIRLCKYINH